MVYFRPFQDKRCIIIYTTYSNVNAVTLTIAITTAKTPQIV